jgi:hypothetical protein
MSVPPTDPAAGAPLQFDSVEPTAPQAEMACANCKTPITSVYHKLNQHVLCSNCRQAIERKMNNRTSEHVARAVFFGLGGAILGAVLNFGVIALIGWNVSLFAIAVGYIVGRAVLKGSGNIGGVLYQYIAVVFTYVALDAIYAVALLEKGGYEGATLAAALVAAPILVGFDPFRLIIIAIGLFQAWRMNAAAELVFLGPVTIAAEPAPVADGE